MIIKVWREILFWIGFLFGGVLMVMVVLPYLYEHAVMTALQARAYEFAMQYGGYLIGLIAFFWIIYAVLGRVIDD